ncbi:MULTISPECIES: hypothetical protein [Rhodopseudomonas]|uniref:hypothetical protein n=1 Tax=Rhodopseudomonas TaxID=1073 RepID=UPI000697C7DE|nr:MULTISPECIES: hypothetical protein [Rhodopseudomonas]MDF3809713.1 hypothetical protein [Rhodopseudomonas sp. BAL398]WOK20877.1 hypothetical protein RBJ75_26050 [Rhodopseudomonas sp. BAL398]
MKRVATWVAYAIGGLACLYLALYAYRIFTAPRLTPGEPIRIFRKPDAPKYSSADGAIKPGDRGSEGVIQRKARI